MFCGMFGREIASASPVSACLASGDHLRFPSRLSNYVAAGPEFDAKGVGRTYKSARVAVTPALMPVGAFSRTPARVPPNRVCSFRKSVTTAAFATRTPTPSAHKTLGAEFLESVVRPCRSPALVDFFAVRMLVLRGREPMAFRKFAVAAASAIVILSLPAAVFAQSNQIQQIMRYCKPDA
jgi:hypothetical protein